MNKVDCICTTNTSIRASGPRKLLAACVHTAADTSYSSVLDRPGPSGFGDESRGRLRNRLTGRLGKKADQATDSLGVQSAMYDLIGLLAGLVFEEKMRLF